MRPALVRRRAVRLGRTPCSSRSGRHAPQLTWQDRSSVVQAVVVLMKFVDTHGHRKTDGASPSLLPGLFPRRQPGVSASAVFYAGHIATRSQPHMHREEWSAETNLGSVGRLAIRSLPVVDASHFADDNALGGHFKFGANSARVVGRSAVRDRTCGAFFRHPTLSLTGGAVEQLHLPPKQPKSRVYKMPRKPRK